MIESIETNVRETAHVIAVHRELYRLSYQGHELDAKLKTGVYYAAGAGMPFPTVGDRVRIQYNDSGDSLITETLPRKSFFCRKDPDPVKGEQAVAANFDYVFILTSLNQDFNLKRLERYLTASWQSGAVPVVVLTKSDLVDSCLEQIEAVKNIAAGVDALAVSAVTGQGIDRLEKYLAPGKLIVFLGSSGVGKSSLLNALNGAELMKVNQIREDDAKGRHTTTHRQMFQLNSGAMVIDTPGMRELGMWDVREGLSEAFGDVEQFASGCKFADCAHRNEPGCAVQAAIRRGELSASRLSGYIKLKWEARFSDRKAKVQLNRQQRSQSVAKYARQSEKAAALHEE